MKKVLMVWSATVMLALAACAGGGVTPQSVVDWVRSNCGFIVELADVTALVTKDPATMAVATFGEKICTAIRNQPPTASASGTGGTVIVDGVPVRYTVK